MSKYKTREEAVAEINNRTLLKLLKENKNLKRTIKRLKNQFNELKGTIKIWTTDEL